MKSGLASGSKNQRRSLLVSALLLPLASVVACSPGNEGAQQSQQQTQPPQAVKVETITVSPERVQSVRELTGRARAFAEAEIRPQVTGLIQKRLFTEGQKVTAGEALYKIDPAEYQAEVQSAAASLEGAEANAAAARETAERFRRLSEINAVSRQDYDNAVAAAKQAEATIGINKAALQRARIDLERTTVRSPISGQIGRSTVTPGALVTANQSQSLARVLQLDPIYVDLTAPSSEVLRWKQEVASGNIMTANSGDETEIPVTIQLENGTTYPETGRLGFSEVNVDEAAGTVIVRAVVPNSDGLLLPGMFITASFSAGSYDGAYRVPQRAIQRTQRGEAYVYVIDDQNVAQEQPVTIRESRGTDWIISEGLTPGARVVVSGFQSLRAGTEVTVQASKPASQDVATRESSSTSE
ncbi:MAG: efflux transporter periplasmic adaptor subunit [Ponticaulis sp.]|nr:efflux transporter periplasmic adaptor subunit [Ponticaulis sp.]|tara:strand:- start:6989 stop:8227 length:1239 start_codon:yes stop_codon:yes gene_type:complete